jgi:hypothetical protein
MVEAEAVSQTLILTPFSHGGWPKDFITFSGRESFKYYIAPVNLCVDNNKREVHIERKHCQIQKGSKLIGKKLNGMPNCQTVIRAPSTHKERIPHRYFVVFSSV